MRRLLLAGKYYFCISFYKCTNLHHDYETSEIFVHKKTASLIVCLYALSSFIFDSYTVGRSDFSLSFLEIYGSL